jgi:hypothetical protein
MAVETFRFPVSTFGQTALTATSTTVRFRPNDTFGSSAGGILVKDPVEAALVGDEWVVKLYSTDDTYPVGAHYSLEVERLSEMLWDNPTYKLYAPRGGGNFLDMLAPPDLTDADRNWADARYVRATQIAALVAAALADSEVVQDAAAAAAVVAVGEALDTSPRIPKETRPEVHPYQVADELGAAPLIIESDGAVQMGGMTYVPLPPETGFVGGLMDWARRYPIGFAVDGTVDLVPSAATIARLGGGRSDPRDTGSDIVLILGQSNAQGAGVPFDSSIDILTSGINQLAGSEGPENTVIPAIESLYHVGRWVDGTNGRPRVGPVMEFARQYFYTQPSNRDVLIVPAALGSTSITGNESYSWDPDNTTAVVNLFHRAVEKTQMALALNPNNRLVAILWHQGESDAGAKTESQYRTKLLQIIDLLHGEFGATVPFLIGGLVPEWVGTNPLRQAIQNALASIPAQRNYTAYTAGPSGMNQDELIHYNAVGARNLGLRFFSILDRARANK